MTSFLIQCTAVGETGMDGDLALLGVVVVQKSGHAIVITLRHYMVATAAAAVQ